MKLEKTDLKSCEKEFKSTGDSGCYATYAELIKDYTYCEKVSVNAGINGDTRFYCFINFVEQVPDAVNWCKKISSLEPYVDQCLEIAAKARQDQKLCNRIISTSTKNKCLSQFS